MTVTSERGYPLVDLSRPQIEGVHRINAAFGQVDGDVAGILQLVSELQALAATKANAADILPAISAAINTLVAGAPEALDTLKEVADKLEDNDDAVAAIMASLATKANAANVYSRATVDGLLAEKADKSSALFRMEWVEASGSAAAEADKIYVCEGGTELTFPASPASGDRIGVVTYADAADDPVAIDLNGQSFDGSTDDLAVGAHRAVVFVFSLSEWRPEP